MTASSSARVKALPNKLVLVRHGESTWNLENRFTGWVDVGLSAKGVDEAHAAGRLLKAEGFRFDRVFTSLLTRAILTAQIVLEELDQLWLPVERSWRLNERHYGALTGLNKKETAQKYGDAQLHQSRRGHTVLAPPPPASPPTPRRVGARPGRRPRALLRRRARRETVAARPPPCWSGAVVPRLAAGEQ